MASLKMVQSVAALRDSVAGARSSGAKVALVPTMGALHAGHLALLRRARREAGVTIVSIFVNPTQFAAGEDLSKYPRTLEDDLVALDREQADIAFVPEPGTMYPQGFATRIELEGPALAGLEDKVRPEHFGGVATVVAKLFIQSGADVAVFGEKDYQQLCVVRRLAADLDIPITVLGEPTVREPDGLALSSRNRYLGREQRQAAATLFRVLTACARSIGRGGHAAPILAEGREAVERAGFVLDYLELRHAETLAPVEERDVGRLRLLIAARLGPTRLIDNIEVTR